MAKPRVVIAMSGGVDSSVAAALLTQQGFEVIGLMLKLWRQEQGRTNRCCTPSAVDDARQVAVQLGIRFYLRDYTQVFKQTIVDKFIEGYQNAVTPNPCLSCNKEIRFGYLLAEAKRLSADFLATGHYARIKKVDGQFALLKGVDTHKDQSYMLHRLDQQQLSHALFPLGEYCKTEVRKLAQEFQLPTASKSESQDLCFLAEDGVAGFLKRYAGPSLVAGEIVDRQGTVLGTHQGLPLYTIGQRKGLRIAHSEPLFVLELDAKHNRLIVGTGAERQQNSLVAHSTHFIDGQKPTEHWVQVKIRYQSAAVDAKLTPLNSGQVLLTATKPWLDVTPGQGAVWYAGDQVLGGGVISE